MIKNNLETDCLFPNKAPKQHLCAHIQIMDNRFPPLGGGNGTSDAMCGVALQSLTDDG